MAKEILRMEDVTKIYDNGFVANKNVTFWLHESEILALVGENGAGKTTLMKVLFGLGFISLPADRFLLKGKRCIFPVQRMLSTSGSVWSTSILC